MMIVTYYYGNDPYDESDDVKAISGIICIGLGVGLLAGGITMGSIGSRKVKQYQQKLDNLSLGMIITPNRQGLTIDISVLEMHSMYLQEAHCNASLPDNFKIEDGTTCGIHNTKPERQYHFSAPGSGDVS